MLCWSKSSEFDFLVTNKRVERGRDVVTKEGREEGGGGGGGVQRGQLRRSTQVTKTCQIPGKSSTELLHHAWNNAWEGEPSTHASEELLSEGLQIKASSLKRIRQIEDMECWKYVGFA